MIYWILGSLFVLINAFFFVLLSIFEKRVLKQEYALQQLFMRRTALIPAIFEVSKPYVNKHQDIFEEILTLRKKEFAEENSNLALYKSMETKNNIHHELNFIFKICNKHPKLIKEGKFIYLRGLIIKESSFIGDAMEQYRKGVLKFNSVVGFKNKLILPLLLPFYKKIIL